MLFSIRTTSSSSSVDHGSMHLICAVAELLESTESTGGLTVDKTKGKPKCVQLGILNLNWLLITLSSSSPFLGCLPLLYSLGLPEWKYIWNLHPPHPEAGWILICGRCPQVLGNCDFKRNYYIHNQTLKNVFFPSSTKTYHIPYLTPLINLVTKWYQMKRLFGDLLNSISISCWWQGKENLICHVSGPCFATCFSDF